MSFVRFTIVPQAIDVCVAAPAAAQFVIVRPLPLIGRCPAALGDVPVVTRFLRGMNVKMAIVAIDAEQIVDRETFHDVFARAFGFPDFYGRNLDAWVDCMTQLDEPFSTVQVATGQLVTLKIEQADDMKERLPELYATLLDLSAFVNWRRLENGNSPVLVVAACG